MGGRFGGAELGRGEEGGEENGEPRTDPRADHSTGGAGSRSQRRTIVMTTPRAVSAVSVLHS